MKLKASGGNYYNNCVIEITLADLGEIATREIAKKHKPQGLKENISVAKRGGKIANHAKVDLEREIGENVITNNNNLNYRYIGDKKKI